MKFGVNTFLFASPFTNDTTPVFKQLKQWGFDSVEISVEQISHIDPLHVKIRVGPLRSDLWRALFHNGSGPRSARNARATANLRRLLNVADRRGGAVGLHEHHRPDLLRRGARRSPTATRNAGRSGNWWLETSKRSAAAPREKGVTFSVEPLNRFETDFINTCDQVLQLIEDVGSPALRVHLDTFHMNIEEKNSAAAIRKAGKTAGPFPCLRVRSRHSRERSHRLEGNCRRAQERGLRWPGDHRVLYAGCQNDRQSRLDLAQVRAQPRRHRPPGT